MSFEINYSNEKASRKSEKEFSIFISLIRDAIFASELSTGQGGPAVLSCPALTRTDNCRTAGPDRTEKVVLCSALNRVMPVY